VPDAGTSGRIRVAFARAAGHPAADV